MTVIISGDTGISPVTASGTSASVDGMTVGRGGGEVSNNTVVGSGAMAATASGGDSVAVGYQALAAMTSGSSNVGIGSLALTANDTGASNVGVGVSSLRANTSGGSNTALGVQALRFNTTASNNTAVGYQAGYNQQTGVQNTYIGIQAGYTDRGLGNTFIGWNAGYTANSGANVAAVNTCVGYNAGYSLTTGKQNCFIGGAPTASGVGAGYNITSGSSNTIIGSYNGNQGGLDIRTASNRIVLSDGDGNPRAVYGASTWYFCSTDMSSTYRLEFDGAEFYPAVDNGIKLGYPSNRWTTVYATTGTINTSDVNQKQDIALLDDAEKNVATAIKSLIKKYRFKDSVAEKGDGARIHIGVIAQEVQAAFVAQGLDPNKYALFCSDTWYEVDGKPKSDEGAFYTAETEGAVEVTRLGIRYDELLAFVIAAM